MRRGRTRKICGSCCPLQASSRNSPVLSHERHLAQDPAEVMPFIEEVAAGGRDSDLARRQE
jgi:hypothetical protein